MTTSDTKACQPVEAQQGPPSVTQDVVKKILQESRELREEYRRRVAKMWRIEPEDRKARSR
jgi:hypothetical protein